MWQKALNFNPDFRAFGGSPEMDIILAEAPPDPKYTESYPLCNSLEAVRMGT